jgi:hypothetical protein
VDPLPQLHVRRERAGGRLDPDAQRVALLARPAKFLDQFGHRVRQADGLDQPGDLPVKLPQPGLRPRILAPWVESGPDPGERLPDDVGHAFPRWLRGRGAAMPPAFRRFAMHLIPSPAAYHSKIRRTVAASSSSTTNREPTPSATLR